ncbi:MAG: 5-oxoprolinase subunit PxpA [Pseudomonadota bacterium]
MLDLNCDLGEGEHPNRIRALMRQIDSANVACGGHAGDARSMARCVRLADAFGVKLGAHPGPASRADFGRAALSPAPEQLARWVIEQAGALAELAGRQGLTLHHIKLHGALYHASEAEPELAQAYAETVRRHFPGVKIYSRSGGRVARIARQAGIEVWEELFADRAYRADGQLVPRSAAGAVLHNPAEVTARLRRWLESGEMDTVDGASVRLAGQTLCVHGDTEGASALIRAIRELL